MSIKVSEVFEGARALLNDQAGAVYTNSVLLPYLKIAYEEIKQSCEEYQIPLNLKTSEVIMITAGITDIGGSTGPSLPIDLVEVLECWERPAGTTNDFMLMKHMLFLPKTSVLTSYLEVWQYSEQYIHFLGANGDIDVKLDYVATGMPNVVDENTLVKVTNAVNFLKYKTAALAAMFIDENETRASVLNDQSENAKDTLLNIKIKSQQNIQIRRRPFMGAYKRRGGLYGR